jgi:GT2 family glycosyltransferase
VLSVVVLSFNRREALRTTLQELKAQGIPSSHPHAANTGLEFVHNAELIVVDNASTDGSADMVRAEFPDVRLLTLPTNIGVQGFCKGVDAARGDTLLILDDDARPDPAGLRAACELVDREPTVGAVALVPVHPSSGRVEWPLAVQAQDDWPFLGCGNVIRTDAWRRVGGYESKYFVYRNDTDFALLLLAAGYRVAVDPAWIVWHDSPAASAKPEFWLQLGTKNWAWLCRRHGRGMWKWVGLAAGASRAIKHAGFHPRRVVCVLRGLVSGLMTRRPPTPSGLIITGRPFQGLIKLRLGAPSAVQPRAQATTEPPSTVTVRSVVNASTGVP